MAATLSVIVSVVKYLNRRGEMLFAQSGRMQCAPTPGGTTAKKAQQQVPRLFTNYSPNGQEG
jgi:hypothetical protein